MSQLHVPSVGVRSHVLLMLDIAGRFAGLFAWG